MNSTSTEGRRPSMAESESNEAVSGRLVKVFKTHPYLAGGIVLAGGGLAYGLARKFRSKRASVAEIARDEHIELSVTVNRSAEDLFRFWRNFENLPRFMNNLESVTVGSDGLSHWTATAAGGVQFEWDAEIYNEKENELIAWRSVGDADVVNAGSVRFKPSSSGIGTVVSVTMNYNPPAGQIGDQVAHLLGSDPRQLIREDLQRFKQLMEGGRERLSEGSGNDVSVQTSQQQATTGSNY